MRLATSRYSNPAIVECGLVPVGFTQGNVRFPLRYNLAGNLRQIAPARDMLGISDRAVFEPLYRARLDTVGVVEITGLLHDLSPTAPGFVMLCFEDVRIPGVWCHRLVFAQWWLDQTGEVVEELPNPNPPKPASKSAPRATRPPLTQSRFVVGRMDTMSVLRQMLRRLAIPLLKPKPRPL
jgi:hypothetical protein